MGIIKDWKAGRDARIAAAKARGTPGYMNNNVDAGLKISGKLADPLMSMLEKYGVADNNDRVHCSARILNSTSHHFRRIQQAGAVSTPILQMWTDELKDILGSYGITENDKQEEFILKYMDEIEKVS
jgi:hypothetical protein